MTLDTLKAVFGIKMGCYEILKLGFFIPASFFQTSREPNHFTS